MNDFATPYSDATADEIELLRAEIEQLQYELAERDAQLAETMNSAPADQVDDATTRRLVSRLEQLLDELERSDGRIRDLEHLLQASEESNRAEREERRQLEIWVTDIETRIGEREKDWQAETEALRHRLKVASGERDQLLHRGGVDAEARDGTEPDSAQLVRFVAENSQLRESLEEAQHEQARMAEQIQQQQDRLAHFTEVEVETREQQLLLAQEQASITRQKAELAALQSDVEKRPDQAAREVDGRVRVFREHLREIHAKEQQQRQDQSLAARVSRIWKRLESR